MKLKSSFQITLIACYALSLSACGSYVKKEQLTRVQTDTQDVKQIANQALAEARQARDLAAAAEERSRQTEIVINRSYKKSMYK